MPALRLWQIGALIGFAVAAASTALVWVKASRGLSSESASAWSGEAQFRLADWLSADLPADAIVVVLLCLAGCYLVLADAMNGTAPRLRYGVALAGIILAVIGALNWFYIDSEGRSLPDLRVSISFGLYALIAGGLVAAVCGLLDETRQEDFEARRDEEPARG